MSKAKDSDDYIDWIETAIDRGYIKYYEYSDFKNIHSIGKGSFGNVARASWKNTDCIFALKSFNTDKQTLKEVVNEVRHLHYSTCSTILYIYIFCRS